MKKSKLLPGLLGVLACLLAAYFALQQFNESREEGEQEAAKAKRIAVTDIDGGDIGAIVYSNGTKEMSFIREEEDWRVTDQPEVPLAQNTLQTLADAAGSLTAVRKLSGGDAPADYGLDSPQYTLTITERDKKETTLLFGNAVGENYYLTVEGTDRIYTVPGTLIGQMKFKLEELVELETFPVIGAANLEKAVITTETQTKTYQSGEEDNADALDSILEGLSAFSFQSCADYAATAEELVGYGLEEGKRTTVEITYKDSDTKKNKTITFHIGNQTEDGTSYYVQMDGSGMVNLTASAAVQGVLNQTETK